MNKNKRIIKHVSISVANAILSYLTTYGEVTCALHHEKAHDGTPRMSVEYDLETSRKWVTVQFNSDYVSILSRTLDNDSDWKVTSYRDYLLIIE